MNVALSLGDLMLCTQLHEVDVLFIDGGFLGGEVSGIVYFWGHI